jgi:rare lipoprotein A
MISIANQKRSIRMPLVTGAVMSLMIGLSGAKSADPVIPPSTIHPAANNPLEEQSPQQKQQMPKRHWYQIGRASWYGHHFQGHTTASGEAFNMNSLTCAHRSLPIGSLIRVTNLKNLKSVVVRVNDRGPILENRIVDLSYAAAKSLDMEGNGVAPVRLERVNDSAQIVQLRIPAA